MKTIVIYYSRTGNTKFVAEQIAVNLNADLSQLTEEQDRSGILGYLKAGRDSLKKRKSVIKDFNFDLNQYNLIVIGCPVWAYNLPPALRTFLSEYDLNNKKVILFCTQNSAGAEGVFKSIRSLIPNAEIVDSKFFNKVLANQEKVKDEIRQWGKATSNQILNMDFNEYQIKSRQTAIYPGLNNNLIYPILILKIIL